MWLRDANQFKQLQRALGGRLAGQALVQAQYLVDLFFHRMQRIERGHRFLEDHGDAVATDRTQFFLFDLQQVFTGIADGAARVAGDRVGQQAQDRVRGD